MTGIYYFKVVDTDEHPINHVHIMVVSATTGEVRRITTDENGTANAIMVVPSLYPNVYADAQPPVGFVCVKCRETNLKHGKTYKFTMKEVPIMQISIIRGLHVTGDRVVGKAILLKGRLESGSFQRLRAKEIQLIVDGADSGIKTYTDNFGGFSLEYLLKKGNVPNVVLEAIFPGDDIYGTTSRSITVEVSEAVEGAHCYNAAGELVMSHGKEKCVSGDLYICLDGVLNVSERDPDCKEVENGKAACPIACVCMGTPLIDALGPIREFRDFVLKRSWLGRCFVSFYYTQVGPFLSLALVRSETLRKAGRWVVRRILRRLEK